jgi:DNA mismatch endonuclease (patch repair protein)
MSKIRSKNTKPEIAVRSILHRLGYRFRLNRLDLPGKPDVVLPKHRAVVLIHGCFWHHHQGCDLAYTPKTNRTFWKNKFENNRRRDEVVERQLGGLGWRVITVWECALRCPEELAQQLCRDLGG